MQPILADAGTYITLIFVILGFLGWIMNLTSNKNAPPPAAPARPRQPVQGRPQNRDERIQSEIDIFLQEVGGRKPRPRTVEAPPGAIEIEEPPPRPVRRPAERPVRRPVAEPVRTTAPAAPVVAPPRPEHRIGSSDLGTTIREQVARHIDTTRVDPSTKQHLSSVVERAVEHHLGTLGQKEAAQLAAAVEVAAKAPEGLHPVVGLLRDPKGVRNAILISEVLGPPRGRRV
jgi:hypothetical protein